LKLVLEERCELPEEELELVDVVDVEVVGEAVMMKNQSNNTAIDDMKAIDSN